MVYGLECWREEWEIWEERVKTFESWNAHFTHGNQIKTIYTFTVGNRTYKNWGLELPLNCHCLFKKSSFTQLRFKYKNWNLVRSKSKINIVIRDSGKKGFSYSKPVNFYFDGNLKLFFTSCSLSPLIHTCCYHHLWLLPIAS